MRNLIEKNLYLNNFLRSILLSSHNKKVREFSEEAGKIDSISDFDNFKEFINIFKSVYSGGIFSIKKSYSESLLYGHINEMFEYAGLNTKDFIYFPIMEHGIQFYMQTKLNHPPRIFQGDYFLNAWREQYPGNPYYVIGPYIHYARPYYDEKVFQEKKSKLGKTLLVFPTHSYELSETNYDARQFVEYVMDELATGYDSVIVCAYWADLEHEIYTLFKSRGAKIVSAGFRGDVNFIRRLKTIIQLSDCVVANSLGTFLGYAVYLKKPVIMVDGNIINHISDMQVTGEMSDLIKITESKFMKEFAPKKEALSQSQLSLCNPYWGLDEVKTKEEIKAIHEVNKMIIKKAHGNINNIGKSANKVLLNSTLSDIQRRVLKDALLK